MTCFVRILLLEAVSLPFMPLDLCINKFLWLESIFVLDVFLFYLFTFLFFNSSRAHKKKYSVVINMVMHVRVIFPGITESHLN